MKKIMDIKTALLMPLFISQILEYADTAVLDPALFLYPSPPLTSSGLTKEQEIWTRASRSTKVVATAELKETTSATSTVNDEESMENAETFWPRLRSIDYALKRVHIPVTFTLSGHYGGNGEGAGAIGHTYAGVGGGSPLGLGKLALAGSSYGNYGSSIRIFGGNSAPAWSGWGNGKWGHYGKG